MHEDCWQIEKDEWEDREIAAGIWGCQEGSGRD